MPPLFIDDRTRARILALALAVGIVVLLLPFIAGLIGAGVLYIIARPVLHRLDKSGRRRGVAVAVVIALFLVLVLPGAWLVAEVVAQLPDAFQQLQQSTVIQRAMALQMGDVNVGMQLRQATSEIVAWSSRQTISALAGVMSATLNLNIALFGAYYLLTSGPALWERTKAVLPSPPLRRTTFVCASCA